jgi:putative transposase
LVILKIGWMMERTDRKNSNNNNFQFWQQHNQPIELFSNEVVKPKLEYIHHNLVVAGYVEKPEDYLYLPDW